jgi:PAS domain S-box-containing protein
MAASFLTKRTLLQLLKPYPTHSFATNESGQILAKKTNNSDWSKCKHIDDFSQPLLAELLNELLRKCRRSQNCSSATEHPGSASVEATCIPVNLNKRHTYYIFVINYQLAACSDAKALQAKLDRSYHTATQLCFQLDRENKLVNHDSAFTQLCLAYNPSIHHLISKPLQDILPPEVATQLSQQASLAVDADLSVTTKVGLKIDGQDTDHSIKIIPIKNHDGVIEGTLCIGQPKDRIQVAYADAGSQFASSLLAGLPSLIYWKDPDHTIIGCTDAMLKHFEHENGRADLETIDKDVLYRNITAEQLEQYHKNDQTVLNSGKQQVFYETASVDGEPRVMISQKGPIVINGKIVGTCGVSTDITNEIRQIKQLKQRNERLQKDLTRLSDESQKTEEQLNWVIDHLPGNVYWETKEGAFLGCNQHMAEWLGFTNKEELIGKHLLETLSVHDVDETSVIAARRNDLEVMRTQKNMVFEEKVNRNGETYTFLSQKSPMVRNGECIGTIGVSLDITQQKALEEKLKTANRLAENALQAKSDFIANVSHDLRTPLHTLYGTAEQLENQNHLPEQEEKIETMLKCSQLILRLVDNVLHFSQLKDGTMQLHEKPTDLQQLIESIILTFKPLAKKKGITLHCDVSQVKHWHIHADPNALSRILINLIQNAMKHTKEGSVSLLATETVINELQSTYLFSVKDTGSGIPKEELSHIFSRFYQGEKHKGYGLGLGLSITQRFTEMMGGTIQVDSEWGSGSTFTCELPIMLSEKPPEAITPFTQSTEKPRILLVEDNELIQAMTVQTLKKLNWEYELASTGEEALLAWRKQNISLILLDLGLPDQPGLDVLSTIRQSDTTTPVITLTGDATDKTRKLCKEKGATGFLTKPATQEELMRVISQTLQES